MDNIEHYDPVDRGEQGVVAAFAYVQSRFDAGTALSDQDIP
jgi:hypothetical protein